jgi:hypothetical protein
MRLQFRQSKNEKTELKNKVTRIPVQKKASQVLERLSVIY